MHRFKNILAVYPDRIGADDVFAQSVNTARVNGAKLTLIDVVPERYATPAWMRERGKRLRRLLPAIHAEGVQDAQVLVFSGTPFIEIIRQVLRGAHDLVVTCPENPSPMQQFYMGSTVTHLVRKCPCPVWVVKPNRDGRYSKVLACIDPKTSDHSEHQLDRKIVELANSLANANAAELHILHAWEVSGADRDRIRSEISNDAYSEILARHETLHLDRARIVLEEIANLSSGYELHMPRSAPNVAILDTVSQHDIDLIVMGSVNQVGVSGFFIGSAAEAVLSRARCGLFTVKPEGFRTPVVLEQGAIRTAV